jgi:hypothetical protein
MDGGSGPAGKNGRHPLALPAERGPPHCIDAAVDPVQSSSRQAVLDGLGTQSKLEQLPPCDHSMLLCRKSPRPLSQLLIG